MSRLLYLSADGLLEPLGYSQVVRVVVGLASRGWSYTVVSLEKERDLADPGRVRAVREVLEKAGHRWLPFPYQSGGAARAAVTNEWTLLQAALKELGAGRAQGVHARSYHGALTALAAKVATGVPYLFDTRSYWFDERLEEGRWFTTPVRLGAARGIEHQLYSQAAGVVTLTELQAEDVRSGRFGHARNRPIRCITTSADFDEFRPRSAQERPDVPTEVREQLEGRLVMGIVGSINRSYLVEESLKLAQLVLDREPSARLLVLSAQRDEYRRRLELLGVNAARVVCARADHHAMPQWLSLIQWGLLLLQPSSPAKRASMPTKLGEFFAAGVRPLHFGCNSEVKDWVRRTGSGLSLDGVEEVDLVAAANAVVAASRDATLLLKARERARPHFSLSMAVQGYDAVLEETFGHD